MSSEPMTTTVPADPTVVADTAEKGLLVVVLLLVLLGVGGMLFMS